MSDIPRPDRGQRHAPQGAAPAAGAHPPLGAAAAPRPRATTKARAAPGSFARAAAIAEPQWGAISRSQLRAAGFSDDEIDHMAASGRLLRMHRGVYVLGARSPAPEQRWSAGLLAAGAGSALSHTTAAAHHGLLAVRHGIEIVAPTQRRGDAGLRVHRSRHPVQTTVHRGLRTTTVAQTLLPLAAAGWPVGRLAHEAAAASLVPLDALRAFAADRHGQRGAGRLREAVGISHARSGWERRFARFLAVRELPHAILNDRVGALTVDVHWPDHDLVVELDTEQTHGTRWAIERDRRRDRYLATRGKAVWRIRAESFDPDAVDSKLRAILKAPARPSPRFAARR